jgi:chemotaxis response regulator CheB
MLVDDAAVVRHVIGGWLSEQPDMQLVGALAGGREALECVERLDPVLSFSTSPCRTWTGSPFCRACLRRKRI